MGLKSDFKLRLFDLNKDFMRIGQKRPFMELYLVLTKLKEIRSKTSSKTQCQKQSTVTNIKYHLWNLLNVWKNQVFQINHSLAYEIRVMLVEPLPSLRN